jgi:hypothetical protein
MHIQFDTHNSTSLYKQNIMNGMVSKNYYHYRTVFSHLPACHECPPVKNGWLVQIQDDWLNKDVSNIRSDL